MRSIALLLLLPLGCTLSTAPDDRGDGLRATMDRASYAAGDTATIRLSNESGQPIGYNLCATAREHRAGGVWRRIEPLRLCTADLERLEAGGTATGEEPITAEWEPGTYRMIVPVHLLEDRARVEVRSEPFTVTR